jgi:hypothetical protein
VRPVGAPRNEAISVLDRRRIPGAEAGNRRREPPDRRNSEAVAIEMMEFILAIKCEVKISASG